VLDYTDCSSGQPPSNSNISRWNYDNSSKSCTIEFQITKEITTETFLYIRIENMYQNHRLYVKSLSVDQLKGKQFKTASEIMENTTTDCSFLLFANCDRARERIFNNYLTDADNNPDCKTNDPIIVNADREAQYYPCGLIANSYFSDEIGNLKSLDSIGQEYEFSQQDIAWPEDSILYKRTIWADLSTDEEINRFLIPPPEWRKGNNLIEKHGQNYSEMDIIKQIYLILKNGSDFKYG
jgi:hypothetical protein